MAGAHAVWRDKCFVGIQIPDQIVHGPLDLQARLPVNQTALGVLEILSVIERKRFHPLGVALLSRHRGGCGKSLGDTRAQCHRHHDCFLVLHVP